jgi:hypothetical protein
VLGIIDKMKELMEEANLHDPLSERSYSYDAFKMTSSLGDLEKANYWIKNAH